MPGVTKDQDNFQSLVQALSDRLGPCSGIDSEDVDEKELQQLMEDYVSDESEWSKYDHRSTTLDYTRNLVDKGNGKSNLVRNAMHTVVFILTVKAHLGVDTREVQSYSRVSSFVRDSRS